MEGLEPWVMKIAGRLQMMIVPTCVCYSLPSALVKLSNTTINFLSAVYLSIGLVFPLFTSWITGSYR